MRDLVETLSMAGYDPGHLPGSLVPGKFYRIPAPGRSKSNRSGWVKLHDAGVASFGDWATGDQQIWRADNDNPRPANRPRIHHADMERRQVEARTRAERAARMWQNAEATAAHPYLARKNITGHGLRVAADGRLLVPVYDANSDALISLQRIDRDGDKRFLKGTTAAAGHFVIPGAMPRIFCEGYATGATVHAATGRTAVICFNAGNLQTVTTILAEPGDVVAADNDNAAKPGERFGKRLDAYGTGHRAAMATGLPWYMPHTPGRDWNDEGADAAAAAFASIPTSAAPIFNAWKLERDAPNDKTAKQWLGQLAAATDPERGAVLAFATASRMFMNAPAQMSLAEIRATIEFTLPAGLVHPSTLDGVMGRLDTALAYRKTAALAPVTIPAQILTRHRHEVCDTLPVLGPADYEGVIVLWAPMASGKTRRIGQPFAAWAGQQSKPVAICHRVSLVHDLSRALGIEHYDEIDAETAHDPTLRGLATCLPSITSTAHEYLIRQAKYLFIDEISQVLRFLSAKDHCRTSEANNEAVYHRLRELVARARCVIVADAGCDARTLEFLESCRPGPFRIIEMRPRRDGIEATYHTGRSAAAAVVGDCLTELAAGGRVWLATESSRRAKALGAFFQAQDYRVLAINGDNKGNPEQAAFLADPETESRRYDIVIASPVIGSGLSIEHKADGKWFTLGAFIGGGYCLTPADATQALRRVRYLRRFTLGILPNNQVGRQASAAILRGLEEAAALEGRPAFPNAFTDLVAQITADEANARADFAAGLLWQLDRAGWILRRGAFTDDGPTVALIELKRGQEEAHRAALLAAPVIDEADARRLEARPDRTELQNITLEAWRIRQSLGIDILNDEALDFWDDGAGVRRLDRFSAWRGIVGAYDDSKENLANRSFRRALAKAYAYIFRGIDLATDRITDALADTLLDRIIAARFLLARLGVVPNTYGIWIEDKQGALMPFERPKYPRREVAELLRRMGLPWRSITTRVQKGLYPLGKEGPSAHKSKTHFGRAYVVTPESLAEMQKWADRRNACRMIMRVEADASAANDNGLTPPSVCEASAPSVWEAEGR